MSSNEVLSKIDSLSIESILNILDALKMIDVNELSEAKAFPGRAGQTIEVKDISEHMYYVGISEYGFVEIIRSDFPAGKIVYMPMDD
jgi:hypothetical protein